MSDDVWYANGLQFECTECGVCCSGSPGFVWIDAAEIAAMAEHLSMSIAEFESAYVRTVDGQKSLTERPDYDCVLLDRDTRRCTVYDDRPTQCRTWPFWDSTLQRKSDWKATCRECPGAGKGKLYTLSEIESRRKKKSV